MLSAGIQGSLPKDFRPFDASPLMPGKTVLWDHHPCGPPISLHFTLYQKPKVVIKDKILGLVSRGLEGRGGGITYANFSGSLAINGGSAGYGVTIYLKNIKETPCPVPVEGEIIAPVVFSWKSKGHIPWAMDHYQRALQNIYENCRDGSCLDLRKMITIQVSCTMQGIKCDVAVEMCTVDTVFKAIPVPPMPVQSLLTDLYCATSATGFITVDTQKRLHHIQENDPAAYKLPLVGIWVKGICTVLHPLVWAACVRYISSTVYEQRLCLPPQPFLICLYNPLKHQPEFYDCISVLGNTWLTFGFERGESFTTLAKVPIVDSKVTIAELTKKKEVPMGFNDAAKRIIQKKITSPNTMVITESENMPQLSYHPHLPKKINICLRVPEVSMLSEDGFDVPVSNVENVDENHDVPVLSESDVLHLNNTGKEHSDPMSAGDSLNVINKSPMFGHEKAVYSNEDSAVEITETAGVLNNSPMSSMMREEKSGSSQEGIRLPIFEVNTTEFEMYGNEDLRSENMQNDLQMCAPKSKECVPNGSESLANKYVTDHFVKVNSTKSNFNIAYSEISLKSGKCSSNIAKNGKDSFAVRCEQGITSELRPKNCVSKKSCLKKKTSSINSKNEEFGRTLQDSKPVQKNHKLSKDKSCASSVKHTQKVCCKINPDAGGKKMLPKQTVTAKNAELTALRGTDQNCRVLQKSEHSSPSHDMCNCAHLQERLLTLEKQVNLLHGNHGKNSSDVSTTESERISVNNAMNPVPPSEHSEDDSHLSLKYVMNYLKHLEGLIEDLAIKQTPHSQLDKSQVPVSTVNVPTLNPAPQTRTTPQHSPHNSYYYSREHLVQCDLNGGACQVPGMSEMSSIHINRSAAVTVTDFTCPRNTPTRDGTNQNVTGPILQQCNLITTATMTSLVWPSYTRKCDNSAQTSMCIPDVSPATKQRDYTPIKALKSRKKKEKCRKALPAETQVKNVEKTDDEIQFVTPQRAKVLPSHSFYKEKNTEVLDNDVQFSLQDIQVPTILDTNQSPEHSIHIEMEDYPATVYCPEMEKSSDENNSSDTSSQEEKRKGDAAEVENKNFAPDNAIIQDVIGNADKMLQKQKTVEKNRLSLPEQQLSVQCYESERRYSENHNDEFHNRQRKKCAQPAGETSFEKVLEWKRSFVMRSRYPVSKRRETDLSMEVNVLADKYLSDKEEDEEPHGVMRGACAGGTWQSHKHSSDLSVYGIDSTNMSIATRKYLDRHQLRFSADAASKQFFDDDRLDSSF